MNEENKVLPAAGSSRSPCARGSRVYRLVEAWAGIQRRVEVFEYPIKDMQDRGWIIATDDFDEIEEELCRFFKVPNVAAIKTQPWLCNVRCCETPQAKDNT